MGMTSSAPTSVKPRLWGGPAASQIDIAGGTTFGQTLMPKPVYPRKTRLKVSTNGAACGSPRRDCCNLQNTSATKIGTGENQSRVGKLNQRRPTAGCARGVQTLTAMITANSAQLTGRVSPIIRARREPPVLRISQVPPKSAQATHRPMPVTNQN